MKTVNTVSQSLSLGLATAFGLLLVGTVQPADARERAARSRTHQTQVQRTPTGHERRDTWSNSAGKTATRDATVVNDRANKTRTRDVKSTGPNGGQATRQDVTQKTENGYARNSTVTNAKGETATRSAVVERDAETGTRTKSVEATGPNGGTRTMTDQVQKTENGYTRSTDLTRANGSTTERDVSASYDPATKTWTKNVEVQNTPPLPKPE